MMFPLGRTRVLMYHAFDHQLPDDDPLKLVVTTAMLEAQMRHLVSKRWDVMPLGRYLDSAIWNQRSHGVLITIDDGYRSVAELALPIFARFGIRPTLFVPPALVGRAGVLPGVPAGELLGAGDLRELTRSGVDIGAHGWDHAEMPGMSDEELIRSTRTAREAVADLCGVLPRSFAYPVGSFDDRARAAVERAGYEIAFSVHRDDGKFAVSRVDVNSTDTVRSLRFKLIPNYRSVWRAAERASFVRPVIRRVLTRA